ncbi:ATPase with role in protein import into the ER [Tulasnella sp. 425]|nr:ATPase with role in protein import into the ER [Tulasnella sp. 425]
MRELREANKSHIIIYDLGRGTFEASFSSIGHGVFEVLANAAVEDKKTGTDASKDDRTLGKLKPEVQKANHTLSFRMSPKLEIDSRGGSDFS